MVLFECVITEESSFCFTSNPKGVTTQMEALVKTL